MVHVAQAEKFYEQDYYTPSDTGFQVFDTGLGKVGIVNRKGFGDYFFKEQGMQCMFRNFNRSYFEKVHEFLIALSMDNHTHINWNWERWEWMFFHPEFDKNSLDKIGLWFFHENLVGVAIYDYYFGEAFFATKKGFEELEKDILDYMVENFSDENGLGIAVNDEDARTIELMKSNGF